MQKNARLFTNYKLSLILKSIHELVVRQNFQGKCLKGYCFAQVSPYDSQSM